MEVTINIEEIKQFLPHRYPMLLVDRVTELDLGKYKTPEEGSIYYFVGADNLRFKKPAVPGDKLILESTVITDKKGIWKFDCIASVEGELVAKATILCADRPK